MGCRPNLPEGQVPQTPFFASRLLEHIYRYLCGKCRNLRFLPEFEAEPQRIPKE